MIIREDICVFLRFVTVVLLIVCSSIEVSAIGEIIYAINAGGEAHTDVNGVHYERDPLQGKVGTASDFGKQLLIGRVPPADMLLYQTERYHHTTFGYDIPIRDDGNYVLVLKFCEVYFSASNMKVFDVVLNDAITVISGLDIYDKVGRGIAHDEYVPFSVYKGKLRISGDETDIDDTLQVQFIKGSYDNPKVNAIYVVKGRLEDVPKLATLEVEDDIYKDESSSDTHKTGNDGGVGGNGKNRRPSGPRNPNPYSQDESSTMLPIFIAIVLFIPILFCLCKL